MIEKSDSNGFPSLRFLFPDSLLVTLNDHPCSEVQELVEFKLAAVQEKVADLKRLEKALEVLLI